MGLFGRGGEDDPEAVRRYAREASGVLAEGEPQRAVPLLRRAVSRCEAAFGDGVETAQVRVDLGVALRVTGNEPDTAYAVLRTAVANFTELVGEGDGRTVRARLELGLLCSLTKRYPEAVEHLEAASAALEAQGIGEPEPLATIRAQLAGSYRALGDLRDQTSAT
jgi:hypothetical protein